MKNRAPHVMLSAFDYVLSRPGSKEEDYDHEVALATQWDGHLLERELLRRARHRGVDVVACCKAAVRGQPNQMVTIMREILRERYDAEISRRTHAKA